MANPTDTSQHWANIGALPQEREPEKRQVASQYSEHRFGAWDWRLVRRDRVLDNPGLNMIVLRNPLTFSWPPPSAPSPSAQQSPREKAPSTAMANAIPTPRKIQSPPAKYVSVPTPENRRKRSVGDADSRPVALPVRKRARSRKLDRLVLVTNGASFVGSHIVDALLRSGYAVRGTVRSSRLQEIASSRASRMHEQDLAWVSMDDPASDFKGVLQGVKAVIHVPAPLPSGRMPEETVERSMKEILNVLGQAFAAGVTRVIVTGTWATTMTPSEILTKPFTNYTFTENDFASVSKDEFLKHSNDPGWCYLATQILAERAAYQFSAEHPSLDLTFINPPLIFGPFHEDFLVPPTEGLGPNRHILHLIQGNISTTLPPHFVDVRDVAFAHLRALALPPSFNGEWKRYLISAGTFPWIKAMDYLTHPPKAHPSIASIKRNNNLPICKACGDSLELVLDTDICRPCAAQQNSFTTPPASLHYRYEHFPRTEVPPKMPFRSRWRVSIPVKLRKSWA
ncbi:NAD(P)-binding protein [Hymenopellis radicata]|nr:NAD(P)-binding protein [Hymenopellis radicata]